MVTIPIETQSYSILDLNRGSEDRGSYKVWFELNNDGRDNSQLIAGYFGFPIIHKGVVTTSEERKTVEETVKFFNTLGRFNHEFLEEALEELAIAD